MDLLKVIFVMVITNRLDTIQNEINGTTELSATTVPTTPFPTCKHESQEILAKGCRDGGNLVLDFTTKESFEANHIKKIEIPDDEKNCYEFDKINGSFITPIDSELNSFCNVYILYFEDNAPPFYLHGISLSDIHSECGIAAEDLCVMTELDSHISCPLKNFTVGSVYNAEYHYIDLKISWDEVETDQNVTVTILPLMEENYRKDCFYDAHLFFHPLFNNTLVKPGGPTDPEVDPGCTFNVSIRSIGEYKEEEIDCFQIYTVPDCVEKKCDCDKYEPYPKILKVEPVSDFKFLITWDPGEKTPNNSSYTIEDVHFKYIQVSKGFDIMAEIAEEIATDMKKHTTEVIMQLFDEKNYTLIGSFKNNFWCTNSTKFVFRAPSRSSNNSILIVLISLAVVMVLLAFRYKYVIKYKNKLLKYVMPSQRSLQQQELTRLQMGQIPMNTNIQYTPMEFTDGTFDEYEIPRNRIILKEEIGRGAFGIVYSAKAIGICGTEGYKMVAAKTLENVTRETTNDFLAEIEIFKKIGKHPNIVALLGCCTVDNPLMMIMEFAPCGDLKKYLVELRNEWLRKKHAIKHKQFFFPDTSDGAYIEPPSPTTPVSVTSSRLPSTSETVSTTVEDPMTPLLADYSKALDKVLDHKELQSFALQIARGMAHLEKISITHRDLAARNILINEYKALKISDFGLSRSGPYINQKTKKLPLRWMAIEAIVEQKYDSKSDVWSFGVVLWEIGTLGAFPYEKVPDSFIQQFLQMGRRLERPEVCTDELYSLMKQCWATDPDKRPTFQELADALDVKKQKIYVNFNQLNPTYVFPPSDIENCRVDPVRVVDIEI